MSAKLKIVHPAHAHAEIVLEGTTSLGRLESNQVPFPSDPLISRRHALVRQQGPQEFVLIDLGSSNGTYLNSKLLVAPTRLNNGDEVAIGSSLLVFDNPDQGDEKHAIPDRGDTESQQRKETKTILGIKVVNATVMVCDIRQFTRLSELLAPEQIARFLGGWFRDVSALVESRGGVVDKYIGDAFMAYWEQKGGPPEQVATLALQTSLELLNIAIQTKLPTEAKDVRFAVGIGLHSGVVARGNVGGSSQRDSSILGDAVNIAFRVESCCRKSGRALLMSSALSNNLPDYTVQSVGHFELKGKDEPLELYSVDSPLVVY